MRGNVLPIDDNPVLMIDADRCVEGAIGDIVALDWRSGFQLADMHLVGRFVLVSDWRIVYGAIDMSTICIGLAPWSRTGHELADWWRIGG